MAAVLVCSACGRGSRPKPLPEAPLREIDAPALNRLLEKHRGDVVLVDFWATWCGPCVELLPHTVELHDRFRALGLVVVTVSLDDPDQQPAVRRLLARYGATTQNFLARYGVGPEAFAAFGIADGALPHLRLYDRQGNLLRTFAAGDAPIDPREVERAVRDMFQ
ncbi:MAG: TlpA family protein disulfide reductase [Planctomycetes bacterium]|nr:TlpA family protein disulfide reductase [Planctomycetota bacterium]MBU4398257.1 TlpA family protein disulfide reductase [Planctomycetota bacterium]MCG2683302.1 TlpA family protein disulfide reductase [Planctomycetales bacterium]